VRSVLLSLTLSGNPVSRRLRAQCLQGQSGGLPNQWGFVLERRAEGLDGTRIAKLV
jgi:hypothetical protein